MRQTPRPGPSGCRGSPPPARRITLAPLYCRGEPGVALQVTGDGCGNWMPSEFRMCASHLKGSERRNILLRDGQFYSQKYEEEAGLSTEHGRCKQGAFFHMQEGRDHDVTLK